LAEAFGLIVTGLSALLDISLKAEAYAAAEADLLSLSSISIP
jgi:hypothetical protein